MRPFEYYRPATLKEAISLAADPGARFIAGGTNLVDLMKRGVDMPSRLIDINHLPLKKIEYRNQTLHLGALVTNAAAAAHPLVRAKHPLLSQALLAAASGQIRNVATIGGNILQKTRCNYFYDTAFACNKRQPGSGCDAVGGINDMHAIFGFDSKKMPGSCIAVNPGDMSVALLALDAVVVINGGARRIPFSDFHRLPGDRPDLDSTLQPGELITAVELPDSPFAKHSHYLKVRDRASYAFAVVSVAAALDLSSDQVIRNVRLTMGGVAHKPWRLAEAEEVLLSKKVSENLFKEAAEAGLANAQPFVKNAFKVQLAKNAVVQALKIAID